jgi:6-phosphofructokinase 1
MNTGGKIETKISVLGRPTIESRVKYGKYVPDQERVLHSVSPREIEATFRRGEQPVSFELAGPRQLIYFDPSKVKAAIVTCGGLCPGINDVIRAIVLELNFIYGVHNILGIKYGLQGFIPEYGHEILELTPAQVTDIHTKGGTILGSSRGRQEIGKICDALERMNVSILFMIGGDGTLKAADLIYRELTKRDQKIAVIGIPKTIDNDIHLVEKSFGFDTAVEEATRTIRSAHAEANGVPNGIGLVKLMGRCSGFIAASATLAMKDVNFCLVPEVDFDLEGEKGLFRALRDRLLTRHHAVVVVAEGAGQKFFDLSCQPEQDNPELGDIGKFLQKMIRDYFGSIGMEVSLKYIDPSYQIRSIHANSNDHIYCGFLAQNAVHAGMAGKTGLVIGSWHNRFVHIPLSEVIKRRETLDPDGPIWRSVLESTGQPVMKNI